MPKLEKNLVFDARYILEKKMGAGGFSEVWLAHDSKADIDVALKVFAPDKGMDEKGIEVFSKEYSLVFNLNHSNLLKPSHFDDFDGSPYLVMPFCKNGSALDQIGEMDEQQLARFMRDSANALAYLHDQNPPIIHQDIKPDNFLIDDKGNYLLSDFGISSRIKRVLTRSVGRQNSSGTLPYMPPEKFVKDRQIIKASDIFSLGVTFYELLTGELPFGEHGGLLLNTGAEIPDLPTKFSNDLNTLISACLAKEPWNRPLAAQLKEIADEYLRTGNWNLSSIIKEEPKEEITEESVKEEKPVKKEGRKTEQFVFADSPQVKTEEVKTVIPETPKTAGTKRKISPVLIIVGVVVLAAIATGIYFATKPSGKGKEKEKAAVSADSVEKAKVKKTHDDSVLKAQLAKKKSDSIAALANKNKVPEKPQEPPKTETKANLVSISCGYGYIYVYPQNNATAATWAQANAICNSLKALGYDDWLLPSRSELNCLFDAQAKAGGFAGKDYWSSTGSGEYAWSQNFYDGKQYNTDKEDHAYVRCIRK